MSKYTHTTLPSPKQRYLSDLEREEFNYDSSQAIAVDLLQSLYERLIQEEGVGLKKDLLAKFKSKFISFDKVEPIKGLYFWGGVGRGKTYLMDGFFESLPFNKKIRLHFHRFMRRVHRDLKRLQGEKNPLTIVADNIADEAHVICFDEFFVSDIADAMLLGKLFELLFSLNVVLVATSNVEPDNLYLNGLQRKQFLPAIDSLKRNTKVYNVDSGTDYRLRSLKKAELYHFPLDASANSSLIEAFNVFCPLQDDILLDLSIEIEGRNVEFLRQGKDVIWFHFDIICSSPRSQNDYIELSHEFHAVLVSGVPQMGRNNEDQARRFINLVDEFYDRNVKVVLSAEVDLMSLYIDGALTFEFQRTKSRLLEMQSYEYLSRPHQP
jgi:cell division protein ZapE|tara:strand:- start:163 stop:1302 length:1140 start_codon:yes stop_codon:yes gene_type:complete